MKKFLTILSIAFASTTIALAQNPNRNTSSGGQSTRTRTVAPKPSPTPKTVTKSTDTEASNQPRTQRKTTPAAAPSTAVLAAFDKIIEGIKRANADMVASAYWNSPSLVLFNYNGSITKGWGHMRKNPEASPPDVHNLKQDGPSTNGVRTQT